MPSPARIHLIKHGALAPFALVAVFGLVTLAGWWSGSPGIVQPRPFDAALPANAALCLLLLGLVPIAAAMDWKRTGVGLAGAAALLAGLTAVEGLFNFNLGIDDLLVTHHEVIDGPGISRASAGLALVLLAAAALLGSLCTGRAVYYTGRAQVFALIGSLFTAYAITAALANKTGLNSIATWQVHARLGLPVALVLLALAGGFFLLAARENLERGTGARWLWLPVVVGGATLTLFFWFALHERELAFINSTTRLTIDNLAALYAAECRAKIDSLRRMGVRWNQPGGTPRQVWERDAVAQFNDFDAFRAFMWLDGSHRTQWLYPRAGNEDYIALDHREDPLRQAAMEEARQSAHAAVAGPISSPLRSTFFVTYVAVSRDGVPDGYIASEIYYDRLLDLIISRINLASQYAISVSVSGASPPADSPARASDAVYETEPGTLAAAGRQRQSVSYSIFGQRLAFTLAPRQDPRGFARRFLPEFALASGLGVSALLGLIVNLAQTAHARRRAAERTTAQLKLENEERRRVETQLKLADERLNLALNSTLVGVYEWDVPTGRTFYSHSLWTSLGHDPAVMPGTAQAWLDLIHPDDMAAFRHATESHFRGETAFMESEYRVRHAGGEWAWVSARAKCVAFDSAGRPQRVIGTCQNVTARKKAEEALRTSQAATRLLSHVASRTENPVVIASPAGTIEWANESFSRLTGYALADLRGALLLDLLAGTDEDPRAIERVTQAFLRGETITTDVTIVARDTGRRYHLGLELQPVRNEEGLLENFIALATDITARVETETELRRAKAEADAASHAKSDFLASMSHEIRTPMNGVIGMTSLLLETELTPEQRDYASTIRTSGDQLLAIINEILDFSKIESGKMELESQPFELAQCVEETLDMFALQAAAKNIELACYLDAAVPPWIEGDMTRLRQVLVNLVNNAVKFTPQGSITVEAHVATVETQPGFHVAHEEGGQMLLDFFITDTGIGIPPDRVHLLFKPFSQVDSSTTRKFGGTGLGLAICDRLCQLMGGSIDVKSKPGEGSTFRFSIQVRSVPPVVDEVVPGIPGAFHGRPVLIMDDHPINRAIISRVVSGLGFTPLDTHNLYNAAEIAVQNKLAGAIIDDIGEYGEKGGTLALQLREKHPDLPIVLYLSPIETARRIDSADPLLIRLPKPVKPALLHRMFAGLFSGAKPPGSWSPLPEAADKPRLSASIPLDVLLVEDNPVNQKVALRFLGLLGYRADAVGNGLEAVHTLERRDYDLVFMDVQMPEMDGFTATREIRSKLPADRQPKIVALTANALQGDRERCLESGMDDYITKPVRRESLEEVITKHFGAEAS